MRSFAKYFRLAQHLHIKSQSNRILELATSVLVLPRCQAFEFANLPLPPREIQQMDASATGFVRVATTNPFCGFHQNPSLRNNFRSCEKLAGKFANQQLFGLRLTTYNLAIPNAITGLIYAVIFSASRKLAIIEVRRRYSRVLSLSDVTSARKSRKALRASGVLASRFCLLRMVWVLT